MGNWERNGELLAFKRPPTNNPTPLPMSSVPCMKK